MLAASEPDLKVVGEADSVASLRQEAESVECDVIVLDLAFADGNGLDVIQSLRARLPQVPIVVFTSTMKSPEASIRAGAAGFVGKDAPIEKLKMALHEVTSGRVFVATTGGEAGESASAAPAPHETLSERELEVMLRLARGMRPKEIAFELGISDKTVATYRSRITKKLQVTDTRGLLLYALRAGLTDWY